MRNLIYSKMMKKFKKRGLTLVELMISTSIMLVIFGGISTILSSTSNSLTHYVAASDAQNTNRNALYRMEKKLRVADNIIITSNLGSTRIDFTTPDGEYYYSWSNVGLNANELILGEVNSLDAAGYWDLDNLTDGVNNKAGSEQPGTIHGNPQEATGQVDGTLDFDGNGDYIDVGQVLENGTPQLTMAAWVYKEDSGDDRVVAKATSTDVADHVFSLGVNNKTVRVRLTTSEGSGSYDLGTINKDEWTHLAMTYDGATLRTYRNGFEIGSADVSGDVIASSQEVVIGNVNNNDNRYWHGFIDDVHIYGTAYSATQMLDLYNLGLGGQGPQIGVATETTIARDVSNLSLTQDGDHIVIDLSVTKQGVQFDLVNRIASRR